MNVPASVTVSAILSGEEENLPREYSKRFSGLKKATYNWSNSLRFIQVNE
jgi:hypothetical protein